MTSTHTRSVLRSAAVCLAPAIILVLSPVAAEAKKPAAAEAKKAKPAAAKKKAAPSPSDTKKAKTADKPAVVPSSAAWEAPPREGETPPAPSPPAAETKPAADSAPAAATAPAESPAAPPQAEQPPPSPPPPPPEEETLPALIPPAPTQYVEHLGPSAYPGNGPSGGRSWWPSPLRWGPSAFPGMVRGLSGGSLWLEPSFHGLQWPYMTKSGVGISGSAWVDTAYEEITRDNASVANTTLYLQQARAVLRVTPTYVSGRFFIQAQAELVANGCQTNGTYCADSGTVNTDDLWLRVGHWNIWDLKVGRFEGWELYHTGMGLDINTIERRGAWAAPSSPFKSPDYYGVSLLHDRPQGIGLGYAALHGYIANILRIELLAELGATNVDSSGQNVWGGRPAAILDLGWVKLKAGYEYEKRTHGTPTLTGAKVDDDGFRQTFEGYGGAVQFVFDPYVEFGGNIARGSQTYTNPQDAASASKSSFTTTSVGGFANLRVGSLARVHMLDDLLLGGGVNWTTWYDGYRVGSNDVDYAGHLQLFGAIQYLLAKQLFIKVVLAYARSDLDPSASHDPGNGAMNYSNTMFSTRLRLMYLY